MNKLSEEFVLLNEQIKNVLELLIEQDVEQASFLLGRMFESTCNLKNFFEKEEKKIEEQQIKDSLGIK